MSHCIKSVCINCNCLFPWWSSQKCSELSSFATRPLYLHHCLFSPFTSLFTLFLPQQCSSYQTVPTSPCSVYTLLSQCHHSYVSCQVELASFSPSCCSSAKNKAPFFGAAVRLQSAPLRGLKLHFLTNRHYFQEPEANLAVWLLHMFATCWSH